jgi:hypothetical protein
MIESWLQVSCDGCDATVAAGLSNMTRAEFRAEMRKYGWRSAPDGLDYCAKCVAEGKARERKSIYKD